MILILILNHFSVSDFDLDFKINPIVIFHHCPQPVKSAISRKSLHLKLMSQDQRELTTLKRPLTPPETRWTESLGGRACRPSRQAGVDKKEKKKTRPCGRFKPESGAFSEGTSSVVHKASWVASTGSMRATCPKMTKSLNLASNA